MPYIDQTYYEDDYKGKTIEDKTELSRYIERASDLVDILIRYELEGRDIEDPEDIHPFVSKMVKKATAAQTEYYVMNEGYEELENAQSIEGSVKVGNFSYTDSKDYRGSNEKRVSPATMSYLNNSGLLYNGVDTTLYDGAYLYGRYY